MSLKEQHELEGAAAFELGCSTCYLLGKPLSLPLSHLVLFVFIVQGWPGKEAISWLQQNPLSTTLSGNHNRSSIRTLPTVAKQMTSISASKFINHIIQQTEVFCCILIDFIIHWTMNGSTQTWPTFRPSSPTETLQMDVCPLAIHLPKSTILGLLTKYK